MKKLINRLLRPTGYKFTRIKTDNCDEIKYLWLKEFNIKSILDVGANEGQFALDIYKTLRDAKIYSFEPLSMTYSILKKNISPNRNMKAFNFALGDFNGQSNIYRNDYSPSSSMLELGQKHLESYPDNNKVTSEEISVRKLDDFLADSNISLEGNVLLKLDVQGFEDKVLVGAKETLKGVKIIFVEVSFWEMYKTQALFEEIFFLLRDLGFIYRGNYNVAFNNKTGLPIFSDGIFIKG